MVFTDIQGRKKIQLENSFRARMYRHMWDQCSGPHSACPQNLLPIAPKVHPILSALPTVQPLPPVPRTCVYNHGKLKIGSSRPPAPPSWSRCSQRSPMSFTPELRPHFFSSRMLGRVMIFFFLPSPLFFPWTRCPLFHHAC